MSLRRLGFRRGTTLVELLLGLAISAWVLGAAFSLFSFGLTAWGSGGGQYALQSGTRLAADIIRDEVRYAYSAAIIEPSLAPSEVPQEDPNDYLVFGSTADGSGWTLEHKNRDTSTFFMLGPVASIIFERSGDATLQIRLTAAAGGRTYQLVSQVLMLNVQSGDFIYEAGPQVAIRYNKAP